MVNTQVWKLVSPPWKRDPQTPARLVYQPKASRAEADEAPKTWKAPGKKPEELKAEG
jgi:nitrogenase molybdenum-iron protein alpha chain